MYLNRLTAILSYFFGRRRKLALCPVPKRASLRCLFIVAAILLSYGAVEASVLVTGDVTPSDNPFTLSVIEGLPSAGNKVDPFATPTPAEQNQTLFEGINDATNNTNINTDIFVGKTGSGILQISQVELRDMNLVIGDSGTVQGGVTRFGDGTVYITGMGALFNNDPYLLPPGLPSNFRSKNRRLDESAGKYVNSAAAPLPSGNPIPTATDGLDGASKGFDLYVGRTGIGTLKIDAFGRAEIEDAVLVGDSVGAVGNLIVDGFNSFLGSGGSFDFGATTGGSTPVLHMTVIGRQGTGNVTISNGATMSTQVFVSSGGGGTQGAVGVSLGSTPYTLLATGGTVMDPGGTGTATITGLGSKWTVAGSFQLGGFDNGAGGGGVLSTGGDLEGDDTQYPSQAGRGTLYVNDGGLVQVNNAAGVIAGSGGNTAALLLAIGRFGTVQLNGGTIQVGAPLGNAGGGQNQPTPDTVQVINDGLITGTGRINTGVFRNRYLGVVRVDPGQSLRIDSTSGFLTAGGATPAEPLTNYGKIEVLGNSQSQAQLEFVRAPADATSPIRPLLNLPLGTVTVPPPAQPAFVGGQISAQWANLRFGSGLENHSMLAFTAGTNNVFGRTVTVGTDPINPSGDPDDTNGDTAQVLVSGPATTAVFHDDLSFALGGDLNLVDGGKVVVLNQHSFTMAGNLSMELSYAHPTLITVGGDVGIGTTAGGNVDLNITLDSDVVHTLKHGDAFEIIAFTGDIGGVNLTVPTSPTVDYTVAPLFSDISFSPVVPLGNLVPQVQFAQQGVFVVFLDPTMVGPGAGAKAPDFNGDGVVDLADFAIWQAHVGIMSGASVLDGDADADGDVDGADFLKWQRNAGRPMPWTGSGSGSGSGSQVSAVPEPASLALLIFGGSLALVCGRRRAKR
jgi:T5SS/PEP-CTERM-associated repeat protein